MASSRSKDLVLTVDVGTGSVRAALLDLRAVAEVSAFAAANDVDAPWPLTANAPSVALPGFKLIWSAAHQPEELARAATMLMPKTSSISG